MITCYKYDIDIVFCLDATKYAAPVFETVKQKVASFVDCLDNLLSEVADMRFRLKVISFGGYVLPGRAAIESPFFEMDTEKEAFRKYVQNLKLTTGGRAEYAYDALSLAMKSDWSNSRVNKRNIIIMFSAAQNVTARSNCPCRTAGLPASYDELKDWWNGEYMQGNSYQKFLYIYSASEVLWSDIAECSGVLFNQAPLEYIDEDLDYVQIFNYIIDY